MEGRWPGTTWAPRRSFGFAWALCAALSLGCVRRASYDGVVAELAETREEANVLFREAETLRAESKRLQALAEQLRADATELKTANAELSNKVDELVLLNAELVERLRGAGQNVEQLASERGNLRQALADTRAELAEWRKQQQAIALRTAQQQQLETSLQPLAAAGRLKIGVRLGRVIIDIPADDLFDPGRATVKATGHPTLVQVGAALRLLPGRSFRIAAHADAAGSKPGFSLNWQLTSSRALAVVRELITAGAPPERLSAAAHAEYDPVDTTGADPSGTRSRRIEIVLVPLPDELVTPHAPSRAAAPRPAPDAPK